MTVKQRIEKLRELMRQHGIDAYIIPSSDAHQSEYVSDYWKSREWISGFTGSAGTVVVTLDNAGLWTDGRYYIQAEKQLSGSGIELFRMGQPGVPSYVNWLKECLKDKACIGFDGRTFSVSTVRNMEKTFKGKAITFKMDCDLIGSLWVDRPPLPDEPVFIHDVKFAGMSRKEKLDKLRKHMQDINADYFILSSLDDIAWLLNIRGNDVPSNPVVISYIIVSLDNVWLYIDNSKLDHDVISQLKMDGIQIKSYDEIKYFPEILSKKETILYDPDKTSAWIKTLIDPKIQTVEEDNITTGYKAIKNDVEIENQKKCYIKDGVALVKFIKWLKESVANVQITEISAEEKLESFRKEQENFIEPSFETIAAYKDHAAMMHYKAVPQSQYTLCNEGFLLVDSGGQYLDGTTDITRTIVLGKLTDEEKRDFTLVLKGHIALSTAKFLYGSTGSNLDVLARRPLWEKGIDYKCGTGHGVGFFLNVHEGPQRISPAPNTIKLENGMVVTNEPGVYKEGKHGIRTENVMLTVYDEKTECGQFMRFETISYCPIDLEAVEVDMLTQLEKDWLNNYHKDIYDKLSPYLNDGEKEWLKVQTREI